MEEMYEEKAKSCEVLHNNLHTLKEEQCKKSQQLETHGKMKLILKENHKCILSFANSIYTSCKELDNEVNSRQIDCKSAEDLIAKNFIMFKTSQQKLSNLESCLNLYHERIDKIAKEEKSRLNTEKENNRSTELDDLLNEISQYNLNENSESCLSDEERERDIRRNTEMEIEILEKDFTTVKTNSEEFETTNEKYISELEHNLLNFDKE